MIIRNKLTLLCLSFFIAFLVSHLVCDAQEIKVMSYNIRYASPNDGPNSWQKRKDDMIKTMLKIKPNVIGLQEVIHSQLMDIKQGMQEYSFLGVGREDGKKEGEFSPIFYSNKELKLLESNTFWLSETPDQISVGWDAALERVCTYARFFQNKNGKEFWIFNTHFDHIGDLARANAVKLILSKIKYLNKTEIPVIITGDFNLEPHEEPIKIIKSVFQDVQENLSNDAINYGTFNGFDIKTFGNRRIDYIFQNGFDLIYADHLWLKTKEKLWVSDHHPVLALLSFKN